MVNGNTTFSDRVNSFNQKLSLDIILPGHVKVINPFKSSDTFETASAFYDKYFNDNNRRKLILGINPGRLGAGVTGIPFTDPKRLTQQCGIPYKGRLLHEPSSAFIYEMIGLYGGPEMFYSQFYISSVCPLGFVEDDGCGREKNYNYFDNKKLLTSVQSFIEWNIQEQIDIGCDTSCCFCLGLSKNYRYLSELNNRKGYFDKIIGLEHPRFIMQYKSMDKESYLDEYLRKLQQYI